MPFSPSTIFDIAVYEADDIVGNDNDVVASWPKQSGTISADPAQATALYQPVLKTGANGINGRNLVLFDPSSLPQNLSFGDVAELDVGTNPFSLFIVIRCDNAGRFFMKDNETAADNGVFIYGGPFRYFNGTSDVAIGASTGSAFHLIGLTRAGTGAGGLIPYYDGTAQTAGQEARTLDNAKFATIGATSDQLNALQGMIAAIYIGSSVPSDANRNAFGDYIQTKYGLTIVGAAPLASGTTIEVQTAVTDVP